MYEYNNTSCLTRPRTRKISPSLPFLHMAVCVHVRLYVCVHVHVCVHMCVLVCVRMAACMCTLTSPWSMFPLIFQSLCAHKISLVQHFTRTQLYLERHL